MILIESGMSPLPSSTSELIVRLRLWSRRDLLDDSSDAVFATFVDHHICLPMQNKVEVQMN